MLTTRGTSQEENGGVLCILRDTVGYAIGAEEANDAWADVEASATLDSVEHIGDTDCIGDGVEGTSVSPEH